MEKVIKHYIFFTENGESLSVAYKLQNEGCDVKVGVVHDLEFLENGAKPEDAETKRRRLSIYDGMLDKVSAEQLLTEMEKYEDKDSYFVFCDFNSLWKISEAVMAMGFVNGMFPTKTHMKMEDDRQGAKEFVLANYEDVKVAPVEEFKKVEDAVEFLSDTEEFWALKGNSPDANTVVPTTKNIEFCKKQLVDTLVAHKEDYERGGFILEMQIRDGLEFCPEMVFYNGVPVMSTVDVENKPIGPANVGIKLGCAANLVVSTDLDCYINDIAFPEAIHKLAKKATGMFVWDANLIFKDGEFYFLEYCANRVGYDSFFTEIEMSESADDFFNSIVSGVSPICRKYGAAVRGINMHKDKDGKVMEDIKIDIDPHTAKHTYIFEVKRDKDNELVGTGFGWDAVVFTGSSDDMEYSVMRCYKNACGFSFDELYLRSEDDFLSKCYSDSIPNRMEGIRKFIS